MNPANESRLNSMTDNHLMLQVRDGDLDQMGVLFRRFSRPLYGFFFRMTADREASEDLVQTVFLRMLKYRHTFTGDGEFRTWMYHVGRNALKDHQEKQGRSARVYELDAYDDLPGGEAADERLMKKQEWRMVRKALESLSFENREIIILSRFQDLKYYEIGQLLGITESTVKVRVHRSMAQLREVCQASEYRAGKTEKG